MITNQARERPAEMVGIVSVAEEWTVARHKEKAQEIIGSLPSEVPFVLDAGTGMYLNALVLDVPLAPKVAPEVRAEARMLAADAENPRREARRRELALAGAPPAPGSIWDGPLRYDTSFVYLRPERHHLDRNIQARSSKIVREGIEEARNLAESGIAPNPSVSRAIGVKEMLLHASRRLSPEEAEQTIATRTRGLARRQVRWFDKLAHSLPDTTRVLVVEHAKNSLVLHTMHDILER